MKLIDRIKGMFDKDKQLREFLKEQGFATGSIDSEPNPAWLSHGMDLKPAILTVPKSGEYQFAFFHEDKWFGMPVFFAEKGEYAIRPVAVRKINHIDTLFGEAVEYSQPRMSLQLMKLGSRQSYDAAMQLASALGNDELAAQFKKSRDKAKEFLNEPKAPIRTSLMLATAAIPVLAAGVLGYSLLSNKVDTANQKLDTIVERTAPKPQIEYTYDVVQQEYRVQSVLEQELENEAKEYEKILSEEYKTPVKVVIKNLSVQISPYSKSTGTRTFSAEIGNAKVAFSKRLFFKQTGYDMDFKKPAYALDKDSKPEESLHGGLDMSDGSYADFSFTSWGSVDFRGVQPKGAMYPSWIEDNDDPKSEETRALLNKGRREVYSFAGKYDLKKFAKVAEEWAKK